MEKTKKNMEYEVTVILIIVQAFGTVARNVKNKFKEL